MGDMYTESIPVYIFVKQAFELKEIKGVTDEWRVETSQLVNIIMSQLNEMGIYQVTPNLSRHMKEIILELLLNSPEIIKLVHDAERREMILARTKKSLSD